MFLRTIVFRRKLCFLNIHFNHLLSGQFCYLAGEFNHRPLGKALHIFYRFKPSPWVIWLSCKPFRSLFFNSLTSKISNFDADLGLCPINFFNMLKGQDLFEVARGVAIPGMPSTISGFRK